MKITLLSAIGSVVHVYGEITGEEIHRFFFAHDQVTRTK